MKFKVVLFFVFLATGFSAHVQVICGTPSPSQPPSLTPLGDSPLNSKITNPSTSLCVDVFYHILRRDNGSNRCFDPNSLSSVNNILNQAFNSHNFFINSVGFDYIDNTEYWSIDKSTEFPELIQINNHPDAINIYIVENAYFIGSAGTIISNSLVIRDVAATT